jgi:hypothetical protein
MVGIKNLQRSIALQKQGKNKTAAKPSTKRNLKSNHFHQVLKGSNLEENKQTEILPSTSDQNRKFKSM